MINTITEEQKARFPEWVDKWVAHGLSTKPAGFDAAIGAAHEAYRLCELRKPMVSLKVLSPYGATIGGAMAWMILRELPAEIMARIEAAPYQAAPPKLPAAAPAATA